jgi:hypothetical protein
MALLRGAFRLRTNAGTPGLSGTAIRRCFTTSNENLELLGTLQLKPANIPLQKGDFFINRLFSTSSHRCSWLARHTFCKRSKQIRDFPNYKPLFLTHRVSIGRVAG